MGMWKDNSSSFWCFSIELKDGCNIPWSFLIEALWGVFFCMIRILRYRFLYYEVGVLGYACRHVSLFLVLWLGWVCVGWDWNGLILGWGI